MWKATIRGLFARKVRLALTALAILLGAGVVLQKIGDKVMPSHYVLEDLSDLSSAELTVILTNFDSTLESDSTEAPLDLERLTPSQLEALLRSLETS